MADDAHDAHEQAAAAFHALQSSPTAAHSTAAAAAADGVNTAAGASVLAASAPPPPRGPYRGKCLYKTGKCPNERALKTSGAAHNLCDEHRRRQNEHQRKLDSKNRTSRRDKRSRTGGFLPDELDTESVVAAVAAAVGDSAADKRAAKSAAAAHARAVEKAIALADIAPAMMKAIAQPSPMAGATGVGPPAAAGGALPGVATTAGAADSKGPFLSTGAQPPQMTYPFMMPDFDGVVVPLPSYLESHERGEFRARIYQKVLDFISEECIRRSGGKLASDTSSSMPAPSPEPQMRAVNALSPADAVHTGAYFAAQALQQQQQQQHAAALALASEREKRGGRVKQDGDDEESASDDDADDSRDAKKLRTGGSRSSRKSTRSEV